MAKLRAVCRLWKLSATMDYWWFTQDRFFCALVMVCDVISNLATVSGMMLLAVRFEGIGGFSRDQVLFMLGFYTLSSGLLFLLFGGSNTAHISRRVGRGQLDHMLIQPVGIVTQLLTDGFLPVSGSVGFLCGLGLTVSAAVRLKIVLTPLWLLGFMGYLITGVLISMGVSFLLGSLAFYHPAACEEVSGLGLDLLHTLGRYPLFSLPGWAQGLLMTLIPAGLTAWLPAMMLLGQPWDGPIPLLPLFVAAILVALATRAFRKGMTYYVKQGANRYRDLGFRG